MDFHRTGAAARSCTPRRSRRTWPRRCGDAVTVIAREAVAGRAGVPRAPGSGATASSCSGSTTHSARPAASRTRTSTRTSRRSVAAIIDEVRPDVAHIHHLTCLSTTIVDELARRGIPVVLTLHDYWLICHRGQLFDTSLTRCDGPGEAGCARCTGVEGSAAVAYGRGTDAATGRAAAAAGALRRACAIGGASRRRRGPRDAARASSLRRLAHMQERFGACLAGDGAVLPCARSLLRAGFVQRADRRLGIRRRREARAWRASLEREPRPPRWICRRADGLQGAAPAGRRGRDTAGRDSGRRDLRRACAISRRRRVHARSRPSPRASGHHQARARSRMPRCHGCCASLDALVFPSVWEETSGIGAREALAAGVPVIASRIGGIPETVRHEVNGLLFEPGDAADLARQIRRLLDEPGLLDGSPPVARHRARWTTTCRRRAGGTWRSSSRTARAPVVAARRGIEHRVGAVVLNYRTPARPRWPPRCCGAPKRRLSPLIVVDNGDGVECRARSARHSAATSRCWRPAPISASPEDATPASARRWPRAPTRCCWSTAT